MQTLSSLGVFLRGSNPAAHWQIGGALSLSRRGSRLGWRWEKTPAVCAMEIVFAPSFKVPLCLRCLGSIRQTFPVS